MIPLDAGILSVMAESLILISLAVTVIKTAFLLSVSYILPFSSSAISLTVVKQYISNHCPWSMLRKIQKGESYIIWHKQSQWTNTFKRQK
jgi:hypothetical protein